MTAKALSLGECAGLFLYSGSGASVNVDFDSLIKFVTQNEGGTAESQPGILPGRSCMLEESLGRMEISGTEEKRSVRNLIGHTEHSARSARTVLWSVASGRERLDAGGHEGLVTRASRCSAENGTERKCLGSKSELIRAVVLSCFLLFLTR